MSPEALAQLPRGKAPGCLSAWQISQQVLGLRDASLELHGSSCASCQARLQEEAALAAAAAQENLPSILLARGGPPAWLRQAGVQLRPSWPWLSALGLGLVGLAAWLLRQA